ncbi:BNR-4 repeat-containing protein [Neiella sp. HB171785]|uniref:BNR-4 repeat-containing protein n=1 Tax=Neiella litorisoli TaxID=2771431 RepID=A0A8J6UEN0_9GAMM|nr:BNR-4 repeat-containing protein [Neiella litorisoli]MBD1389624.1 BNR-4 repeat-containing protein [Neiella litorisoli]
MNIVKFGVLPMLAASLLCGCSIPPATEPATDTVDYFASNGYGEGVAVVQHPAGEYRNGVTYVAYQGSNEDPYVAAYNHETKAWLGPFKAGTSILGKDPSKKIDSHGKPTLLIDDAGYIHVFYGGHGGVDALHGDNQFGNAHSGENKHAVSTRPYDVTSWQDLDNVSPFGTYNQAIKMDNGDIYLFYRHGAHRSDWVYQKSTDNGRSFDAPVSFLKHKRRHDMPSVDSWYAYVSKGVGDDIVVGFDYHFCWDKDAPRNNRGGHSTERRNLYFMVLNTQTGDWRNVEGKTLTVPLTKEYADQHTLAIDTGDLWTFNGSTKVDANGNPHIAAYIGKDIGWQIGGPKNASYFRWDGSKWDGNFNSGLPIARGDFLAEGNEVRFLLSGIDNAADETIVRWWQSSDGGNQFVAGAELLRFNDDYVISAEEDNSSRPKSLSNLDSPGSAASSFIRNAHPDARIIIAEKIDGTDMRRMYLVGDNGPVVRSIN